MASLREIRQHISAVNSLWQMTNAMKKVAIARARRHRNYLRMIEPYARGLERTMSLLALRHGLLHPLLKSRPVIHEVVLVIGSERGLCGAYNLEVIKGLAGLPPPVEGADRSFVVCGKRLGDLLRIPHIKPTSVMPRPRHGSIEEIRPLADELTTDYLNDRTQRVTVFRTTVDDEGRREATYRTILPARPTTVPLLARLSPEIEPGSRELFDYLLPRFILSELRMSFLESMALEEEARALAMQAAANNAEDLEVQLKKQFRRARQERITRELLELVAAPSSGALA